MTRYSGDRSQKRKKKLMCDDEECPEIITNPLLMTCVDFTAWLSVKGVDAIGIHPSSLIKRANLLFELAETGRINPSEIEDFLREIGLMVPIREN